MRNKFVIGFFVSLLLLGGGYLLAVFLDRLVASPVNIIVDEAVSLVVLDNQPVQTIQSDQSVATNSTSEIKNAIQLDVPFIVQAPFGNWSNPVFQGACEEASIVMAMSWLKGIKNISPASAKKQIQNIVDFENTKFGYNTDTDVFDVQKIFQQFFKQQNVSVQENIKIDDIKQELQKGNLVLVPAFGQVLNNLNYTAPGPVEHMLVIIGYDPATHEFITNDPGTRRGAGYRYAEKVLFDAIWAYPSGAKSVSAPGKLRKKSMIVAWKNN